MTDKMKKPRKEVQATLNQNRHKDIQELADIKIEDRSTKHKSKKTNRYAEILKNRKIMKKMREEEKRSKIHIGKRKHIEKRAIAEAEE